MSNLQQSTTIEGFEDDKIICLVEVADMESLTKNKAQIIKSAALKLESSGKYDDKIDHICVSLQKMWPSIAKSYVNEILDDKYKRIYTKKDEDTPETLFEEILFRIQDLNDETNKMISSVIKKIRTEPEIKEQLEKTFIESIHNLHSNSEDFLKELKQEISEIRDMNGIIKFLKKQQVTVEFMINCTDWREKLDPLMKIRLNMCFIEKHFSEVAKTLHLSSKWMSQISRQKTKGNFVDQQKLFTLVEKLHSCPACGFDMFEWFNKNLLREKQCAELIEPEIPNSTN